MTSTLEAKFRSKESVSRNVASLIEHRGEGTNERTGRDEGENEKGNPVKGASSSNSLILLILRAFVVDFGIKFPVLRNSKNLLPVIEQTVIQSAIGEDLDPPNRLSFCLTERHAPDAPQSLENDRRKIG